MVNAQRKCIAQAATHAFAGGDTQPFRCYTQLLAYTHSRLRGYMYTRVCGGYTRPFAEATRSRSQRLTLDYVNDIQAR